jgi:hypothetical protein
MSIDTKIKGKFLRVIECSSFEKYLERVKDEHGGSFVSGSRFFFRGQASDDWELKSSFDRLKNLKTKKDAYEFVMKRFADLILRIRPKELSVEIEKIQLWIDGKDEGFGTDLEMLAQHHGLSTRLLDWSFSPYIAAFFAVESHVFHRLKSGITPNFSCIWSLDTESGIFKDIAGLDVVTPKIKHNNARFDAQNGCFTRLTGVHSDIESAILDYYKSKIRNKEIEISDINPVLRKFRIPSSKTTEVLRHLEVIPIKWDHLMPDFEGVVKAAVLDLALNPHL